MPKKPPTSDLFLSVGNACRAHLRRFGNGEAGRASASAGTGPALDSSSARDRGGSDPACTLVRFPRIQGPEGEPPDRGPGAGAAKPPWFSRTFVRARKCARRTARWLNAASYFTAAVALAANPVAAFPETSTTARVWETVRVVSPAPQPPNAADSVSLSVDPGSVSEDAGPTVVAVTAALDGAARSEPTTVTVSVGATNDSAASGTDYAVVSDFEVTIAPGAVNGEASFTLTPTDDLVLEETETITISGSAAGLAVDPAELTLEDDDVASSSVELSVDPTSVSEDGGVAVVSVTAALDGAVRPGATTVTVTVGAPGDSATSGTDYAAVSDVELTIRAGATSGRASFTLRPTNDQTLERDEAITVSGAAAGLTVESTTMTLEDDEDDGPSTAVLLTLTPSSISERSGPQDVLVTARLDGVPREVDTVVRLEIGDRDDTARPNFDYQFSGTRTTTIAAGKTEATLNIRFDPRHDGLPEGEETVTVTASSAPLAGFGVRPATLTITDDDPVQASTRVALSLDAASVSETSGATTIEITATLDGAARWGPTPMRISVGIAGDTALSGSDYQAVPDVELTILPLKLTATASFTVIPTDDLIHEGDETITVAGIAAGMTVDSATVTIEDDDEASTSVLLSLTPASVWEDAGPTDVLVTASLDGASKTEDVPLYIYWGVYGDSATGRDDYLFSGSPDLVIRAGQVEASTTLRFTPTDDQLVEGHETVTVTALVTGITVRPATLTIEDDDGVSSSVLLSVDPASMVEDAGRVPITVTATLDGLPRSESTFVRIIVGAADDTATAGYDYWNVRDFLVTIPPGSVSAERSMRVHARDDAVVEDDETITVQGSAPGLTVQGTTLTLEDDDGVSTSVRLSASPASLAEGSGTTIVAVTAALNGVVRSETTVVRVSVGAVNDSARSGVDYETVADLTLTIPMGSASADASFRLTPVDDGVRESDETLTVSGATNGLDVESTAVTLEDNDTPSSSVTFTLSPDSLSEGAGPSDVLVTARLDAAASTKDFTIAITTGALSDTADRFDYRVSGASELVIRAGEVEASVTLVFTPTDDQLGEGDETITVRGLSSELAVPPATLTIEDDDPLPISVSLLASPVSVSEDAGATVVAVTAALVGGIRPEATELTVSVGATGDSAASGTDYEVVPEFVLTIPKGMVSGEAAFTLTPEDDGVAEGDEAITVSGAVSGFDVEPAELTLEDDEVASTSVSLSVDPASVSEDAGATVVTVTAALDAGAHSEATVVTVSVSVGAARDTAASGTDYEAVPDFTLTIPPGSVTGEANFALKPVDDGVAAGDETITVSGEVSGLAVESAELTLADDDVASGSVLLSVDPGSVSEDAGSTVVAVTAALDRAARPEATRVTVSVGAVGDSAVSGADYAAVSDFAVTIPGGALRARTSFTLWPTDDALAEGTETIAVSGMTNGLAVASTTLDLADNDEDSSLVFLSVSSASVSEDSETVVVEVTAALDGAARPEPTTITVSVGATNDSAAPGTDYVAVSEFLLTIPAGSVSGQASFALIPADDEVSERDETITVSGTVAGLAVESAELTLEDDDAVPGSIELSVKPMSVSEASGATVVEVTATLFGAARSEPTPIAVSVGAANDSAVSGTDYAAVEAFALTIPVDGVNAEAMFTLTPTDDAVAENDETITVSGSAAGLDVQSTTVTLEDDDGVSTSVNLSLSPASLAEDAGATVVAVTAALDGAARAAATTVTVSVGAAGDTAASGTDYVAVAAFAVTIPMGSVSQEATFTLTPVDDAVAENFETITVSGAASGLVVEPAAVTLEDDDAVPASITLSVAPRSVSENAGTTMVAVTAALDGAARPWATAVTVSVGAADDSAVSGTDYAAVPAFTLTIPAEASRGEASFALPLRDDGVAEGDETITVSGAAAGLAVERAELTLEDDDAASGLVELSVSPASVSEGAGTTVVKVTAALDGAVRPEATTVTMSVGAAGDTAVAGFAYEVVPDFRLTIPMGFASGEAIFTLTPVDDEVAEGDEAITVSGEAAGLAVESAELTLEDNDTASRSVELSLNPAAMSEGSGATVVAVTAALDAGARLGPTTVTVSVGAETDTAQSGTDYEAVPAFRLTISAGSVSGEASFTLTPEDDRLVEEAETVTVSGSAAGLTVEPAELTLSDDDTTSSSVSLSVEPGSVPEGAGATVVAVTAALDGAARAEPTAVTVSVGALGDAAAPGTDYEAVSSFVLRIAAGSVSEAASFTLTPVDDGVAEGDETITVAGVVNGLAMESAELTLEDNDVASSSVSLSVAPRPVSEDAGPAVVTVTAALDGAARTEETRVTVSVGAVGDPAAPGTDYAVVPDFMVTIAAGVLDGQSAFTLTPLDDGIAEGDEAITVSGAVGGLAVESAELTLEDDDVASGSVSLSVDPVSVLEGAGPTVVAVTAALDRAARPEPTAVTVSVGAPADTAASGTDYAAVPDITLTIPAGAPSGRVRFTLAPADERILEGAETITVLGSAAGLVVEPAELTLEDDEVASSSVSLSVNPASVSEDAGATVVTVTAALDGAVRPEATPVTVSVGAAGDAAALGTDYQAVPDFTLTIPPEALSGEASFTLTPEDDGVAEGDEAITVLGAAAGLTVDLAELTLEDDDTASSSVSLSVHPGSVSEDAGPTVFAVTAALDGAARPEATAVTVSVGAPGDTAASGTDYEAVPEITVTIPGGNVSAETAFTVVPKNDVWAEGTETITVLGEAAGLAVDSAALTLEDNDEASTAVRLLLQTNFAWEGGGPRVIGLTAELDDAVRSEPTVVTVSVGAAGDTAVSGTDYQVVPDRTLTIPAGAVSARGSFPLTPTDDALAEGTETITVSGEAAGLAVEPKQLLLTDDDLPSTTVELSVDPGSVSEASGATVVKVTAALDGGGRSAATTVTVSVGAAGDTAARVTDYGWVPLFRLTIPKGAVSGKASFTLTPVDDGVGEGDEAITVSGTTAGLTVESAELTLEDDDAASSSVSLSVDPRSVSEDAGPAVFAVTATLDGAPRQEATPVTVSVGAADDSAVSGTDYATAPGFVLTIPARSVSAEAIFTLIPVDDGIAEGDEAITVSGEAAGLAVESAELTLEDDDAASSSVSLSVAPASVSEDAGATVVTVTAALSGAVRPEPTPVTVSVGAPGDSAVSGTDYEAVPDITLTIAAGSVSGQAAFALTPVDDEIKESDEAITVSGSAMGLAAGSAELTLEDDDEASSSVSLSVDPGSVPEDARFAGRVTVTAALDAGARLEETVVTVSVGAPGDTAASGIDYQAVSDFTLTISAGSVRGNVFFWLRLVDDGIAEGDEAITVSGAVSGLDVEPAELTLEDDDVASSSVSLSVDPGSVSEDAGPTVVSVTAALDAGAHLEETVVTVSVGAEGDAAVSGTDYQAVPAVMLTIPAGSVSGEASFTLTPEDDRLIEAAETLTVSGAAADLAVEPAELTLEDNDRPSTKVSLLVNPGSVSEDAGPTVVAVTAALDGGARLEETVVTVSVGARDTAVSGTDYQGVPAFTVTIPAGSASGEAAFTLTPMDDGVAEGDEAITVSGEVSGLPVVWTKLTLADDDEASMAVQYSLHPDFVWEGGGPVAVEVTAALDGGAGLDETVVTVSVGAPGDTAASGTDYQAVPDFTLTIPAGAMSAKGSFTVVPRNDVLAEGTETITVSGSATGLAVEPKKLLLTDDDLLSTTVSLSVAPGSVSEDAGSTVVTVTAALDGGGQSAATAVTVSVGAAGDSAASGTDYQAVSDLVLTIQAGSVSGEATFTLTPVDDGVAEGDEAITVSGSAVGLTVEPAELALEDDDEASSSVELSVSPRSVSEDGGAQQIAVTAALDGAARLEATLVTVSVGAADDTAVSGTDYVVGPAMVLTIPARSMSGEATFTLAPVDDGVAEGDEAITVSGSATGLAVEPAELTLEDDDAASSSVELSVSPASVSEDAGPTVFAVTAALDGAARPEATVVTVSVGAANDTAASGTDYQAVSDFTLTIPATSLSARIFFLVVLEDDEIAEGDEAITVSGSTAGLTVEPAELTLEDDDEASTSVELSVSPVSASEDGGAQQIEVTAALDGGARLDETVVTVSVGAPGDTAASGTDYQAVADFVLTIAPEALTGEAIFTLTPVDDGIAEGDEAITVSGTVSGLSVEPAELTLEDDDEAPTSVELSVSPAVVSEDGGAQQIAVTAALDGAARSEATPVTVTVGAAGDAAASGTDYQAVADFVLTIAPEALSGEATFTLTPVDDGVAEGDEAITVRGSASGLTVEPAELTLEDDDEASTSVELSVSPVSVSEDGGAQQIAVTAALDDAARPEATPVTVTVGAAGDTAASGTDYQAVSDYVLTIAPGALSGEATFTLTPVDDGVAEGDEAITVSGSASGLTVEPAELTLEDDDEASTSVELSVSPVSASEDGGAQQIAVTAALDGGARLDETVVTVSVGAPGDTAALGTDYQAVSDFVLTIPEGFVSGEATFTLTPVDDGVVEGDEAITVSGSAVGLTVEPAALTLEDDDEASTSVELSVSPAVVSEDGGAQQIEVTAALDGAARTEATVVTVSVGAAGDSAASGTDYQAVPDFVLTIPEGFVSGEATFTLTSVDDGVAEGDEAITVSGSAVGLTVEPAELTLEDDDEASTSVELSVSPASASEGGGAQQIEVTAALAGAARSEATSVTVSVGAANDSAASGTDYQVVPDFTLTIAPGALSGEATFTLTPEDDGIAEGDEAITVSGSAVGLTVEPAALTLEDDDEASTSVELSVSPAVVSEDGGAQQIAVTAALDGAARSEATPVTVSVGAAGDAAASGTDYQAASDFVLTIPEGFVSGEATFTLTPVDDGVAEGDEAITVSGSASGLTVEPAELTLEDDDEASTSVELSVSPASASEDGGAQQIEVTAALNGGARTAATAVNLTVGRAGDSAVSGTDYASVAGFVLTIEEGRTSGTATFTLTPADDEVAEGDEAITVHGSASGLTVNDATLALNDDDTASTSVELSLSPASASEDGGAQQIAVTAALAGAARSEATPVTVSVGAAGRRGGVGTDRLPGGLRTSC